jgi:hypothetical protein
MKKLFSRVLSLYLVSTTCMACTIEEGALPDPSIVSSSSDLITDIKANNYLLGWSNVGDTTIKVKADKDVLPAAPSKKPDLALLKNGTSTFRLLSVGGALSAGFRDGGLYREGQLTAFPNLIAQQMGVTFSQPLFDVTNGNGSGYKAIKSMQPLATFKMVTNNLAYEDVTKADKLKKYTDKVDNFAFPNMDTWLNPIIGNKMGKTFADRFITIPATDDGPSGFKNYRVFAKENCDFFILEAGMDDLVYNLSVGNGPGLSGLNPFQPTGTTEIITNYISKKSKGVLLNIPDILDFPYYNQITPEKINKLTNVVIRVQTSAGSENYRSYDPAIDKLIPTPMIEKLLRGEIKGLAPLSDYDVLSKVDSDDELRGMSPVVHNSYVLDRLAKSNNLPVVDIYGLYKKIIAGKYTTDDGVLVDAKWPSGNFFSQDGIYPTAFGQAVIANEVIKTINQHYKVAIPLTDTRFFLKK